MSKITFALDVEEAKNLIEQMPLEDKIKLMRELQKATWVKRMDTILKNIDERRKRHKISPKEISKEIEKARHDFYAHHH